MIWEKEEPKTARGKSLREGVGLRRSLAVGMALCLFLHSMYLLVDSPSTDTESHALLICTF